MVFSLTCILIIFLNKTERGGVLVSALVMTHDVGGTYLAGEP